MTGFTDFSSANELNYVTGQIPSPTLPFDYVGLLTVVGTDAGTGFTEVSGGTYARVQVAGTLTTNGATTTSSAVIAIAVVPAWVVAGMSVYDVTNASAIGTVLSTTATTVTLTASAAHAVANGDSVSFSAFAPASGTSPSAVSNTAAITFPTPTASWGSPVAIGFYDAGGNLLAWDYLGTFSWLPVTISMASPAIITAPSHPYSNGDSFVFTTEYGGAAPSFSAGNLTGLQTVAGSAKDVFNVTGLNTSSSGSGMVRKVNVQSIATGAVTSFAAASVTISLA